MERRYRAVVLTLSEMKARYRIPSVPGDVMERCECGHGLHRHAWNWFVVPAFVDCEDCACQAGRPILERDDAPPTEQT